jgi:hypothetical protein
MEISKYFDILDESKWYQDRSLFKYRLSILLGKFAVIKRQKKACNRSIFQPAQDLRRNCTN